MKEIFEFRIANEYAHLLLAPGEGKRNSSNTIIYTARDDPRFEQIGVLNKEVREKNNDFLFLYSKISRSYSNKQLDMANLLHIKIKSTFEPAGEECGTKYDETVACNICGANREQVGSLKLKKGSIPKKDIARTIAGEVVVSEKFAEVVLKRNLKGLLLSPIVFNKGDDKYYQLTTSHKLELTGETMAGVNIFDFSESSEGSEFIIPVQHHIKLEKEVYKCPLGHTTGLNILSELYVFSDPSITDFDFFSTKQKIGVKRGLLRPEPLYLCSANFRKMVEDENLTGFEFEVAHIE